MVLPSNPKQFIRAAIKKHRPEHQARVAKRVAENVQRHHNKTVDPILRYASHPDTGVSWEGLARIAIRGDFKNRKQLSGKAFPQGSMKFNQMCEAYAKEYQDTYGKPWRSQHAATTGTVDVSSNLASEA
jgi:hypothetical protein